MRCHTACQPVPVEFRADSPSGGVGGLADGRRSSSLEQRSPRGAEKDSRPSHAGYSFAIRGCVKPLLIAWLEEPFRCEYRREPAGSWLHIYSGEDLVRREPIASLVAAYQRARELSATLLWKSAKGA